MTLRLRSALILGLAIAGGIFGLFLFVRQLTLLSYSRLEEHRVDEEIRRVRNLVLDDLLSVGAIADEIARRLPGDGGDSALPSGPSWSTWPVLADSGRLEFAVVLNEAGEQTASLGTPPPGRAALAIAPGRLREIASRQALARLSRATSAAAGFLMLPEGPAILALRPITTNPGTPSPGTLVVGRLYGESDLVRIRTILSQAVQMLPYNSVRLPEDLEAARSLLSAANPTIARPLDEHTIGGYALIDDLQQRPALLLRIEASRDIMAQGNIALRYLFYGLAAIGVVLVGVTLLVLERFVISLEAFKAEIIRNVASGLVTFRPDGLVTLVNPAALRILEIAPPRETARLEDVVGARFAAVLLDALREGTDLSVPHEIALASGAGRERIFGYTVSRMGSDPGRGPQGIVLFRDLTESRKLEEDLQRLNRLVSLGEVSAQMAHELRNPLTAMYSMMQFLAKDLAGEARDMGRLILENMERMVGIIRRMSLLTREASAERVHFDLCDLLDQVVRFLDTTFRSEGISLRRSLPPCPIWIDGDPSQLYQALLNILINAVQAMPGGGELEIDLAAGTGTGAPRIVLSVADTGRGIAPGTAERILDPFFTTKPQGTGLGLSIAHRVLRDHGGTLRFANRPAGGAVFTIELPVAPPPD